MTRLALVTLLALAACGNGKRIAAIEALTGDPTAGKTVYDGTCPTCHGASGEGGSGPALAGTALGEDEIADQIISGGDTMAPYGDTFSQSAANTEPAVSMSPEFTPS